MKTVLFILIISHFVSESNAQDSIKVQAINESNIQNPQDLRDPFKRKLNKLKRRMKEDELSTDDRLTQDSALASASIESLRVVGVIIGPERRAIIKINQNEDGEANFNSEESVDNRESYFVKEGTLLGPDESEVKAILPGGIVIVKKIKNVYDQDEYLETIIPVTDD